MEATATLADHYTNTNGKCVYRYVVAGADSQRGALDALPEDDYKVYWWNNDRSTYTIEIIRHF